jgi:hypothetical protein
MRTLLSIAVLLGGGLAYADSNAKAEVLFRQGRDLMAAGKLAEACAAFDASQKLDPATTTLFNQADCREKNGQLATAWGLFVDAERKTRGATDAVGAKLHKVATDRAAKLEPRLSTLTVNVKPAPGLVVFRGDEQIEAGEWNRALPIDGGEYTFVARIGGREVWSETIMIAKANARDTIDVVVREPAQPVTTPAGEGTPMHAQQPTPIDAPPAPPSAPGRSNTTAIVLTVSGGVLLAGALGLHLKGNSTYDEAVETNDEELWNTANNFRYAAQGFLAGGIVCAGIATYLWLRDDKAEAARVAGTKKHVTPIASPTFAGLGIGGAW